MIARIPHPEEPDRFVFVPVRYEREAGEWIPIDPKAKPCDDAIEAARMCFKHLMPLWSLVAHHSNILRVLCEHPNFGFEEDGVDAVTVHREAMYLASAVTNMNYDFAYLFQDPDPEEIVRIGDKVMTGAELADLVKPEPAE